MLGREVVEGQQGLAMLAQALDCPGVLRPIFLSEDVDRGLRRRAGLSAVDLAQVGLHSGLDGAGDLVQHVGSLVHPTALMASAGIDLLEGLPEPQFAVTDRDLGRDGQPAALHLDQELTPALSALPDTDLEAHQFLRALGRRADDVRADGVYLQARMEEHAECMLVRRDSGAPRGRVLASARTRPAT